jgi:hypothetical protein
VATPDTEPSWLAWARGRRLRQVERAVAGRRPGETPRDRPDPSRLRHRLAFEVRAETIALFRDLQAAVRADLGTAAGAGRAAEMDDDILLYEIARRALGGPEDEGRASYQVAVVRCDACGQMSIDAGGESHMVDETFAEMVACDSQDLGAAPERRRGDAPPRGGDSARSRATQSIPPAIRRHVWRRDRKRCRVTGCQNHRFLDVHHIDPRAEGGGHDPERLICLCGAHHLAHHDGRLAVSGTASSGFTFHHADGTPYGQTLRPAAIDVSQQVFSALRHMGFKETRARALVDQVLAAGAPADVGAFLHAALRAS